MPNDYDESITLAVFSDDYDRAGVVSTLNDYLYLISDDEPIVRCDTCKEEFNYLTAGHMVGIVTICHDCARYRWCDKCNESAERHCFTCTCND